MKKLLISSAAIALLFAGCNNPTQANNTVTNKTVKVTGIRQAGLEKDSQNLAKIEYTSQAPVPGKVKPFKKSFVTAPPMIPHSVKGMVPIKIGKNQCLGCHTPQTAKAMHITAIPADHFVDNFEGDKKIHRIAGSRYNCTQCHAPQAKLDPVIENRFESIQNAKLAK
jgi:cytochrome c-type protein NapB